MTAALVRLIKYQRNELFEFAELLVHSYNAEHDLKSNPLPWGQKGTVKVRVRHRPSNSGGIGSMTVEWYYLYWTSNRNKCFSKTIKRGKSENAFFRAVRKQCQLWEYELFLEYYAKLEPIRKALEELGKMSRGANRSITHLENVCIQNPDFQMSQVTGLA